MLERPRARRPRGARKSPRSELVSDLERRRSTDRQRRYRARLRSGTMPITIDVAAETIAMLVETRWLREADASDKAAIAIAIERLLADAAGR
jgi:hypothetical protein